MTMIQSRSLTRSGLQLTEIGLGCATIAFFPEPENITLARQMLSYALQTGINYFDTAPYYGRGLSERLVGDALRRQRYVLSSKVGRILTPNRRASTHMPFDVQYDYSYDGVMRSIEHSLLRLGLDRIDIAFAHDLGSVTHGKNDASQFATFIDGGGYRAMDELRKSGDIKAIGLGVNEVEICQRAMLYGDFDVFLLAGRHTLLERDGALDLFHACRKTSTDIIIGGPFNSGMLVGGTTYNYEAIPDHIASQHTILLAYCQEHNVEIGAAALQFPLRQDVVKSVIAGPKTTHELDEILNWSNAQIPDEFWQGLNDLSP